MIKTNVNLLLIKWQCEGKNIEKKLLCHKKYRIVGYFRGQGEGGSNNLFENLVFTICGAGVE